MYDVVIIGAGPAGLTAAIYSSRRAMKTLVISGDIGGQITKTYDIENYPGYDLITGFELATKMRDQAEKFGAKIILEEAKKIAPQKDKFVVKTAKNQYEARTIILAFGKKPRELGVPGEEEFKGRGVTYCATCDAPFFKNKVVAVAGGGNSALDAALLASKISKQVYLIHRRDEFRGEQHLIDRVKKASNVEFVLNSQIKEVKGDKKVNSIVLSNEREIAVDGVMVEVGYVVDRSLVEGLIETDSKNQIHVNAHQETSVPGIFAAGDITPTPFKQIVISAGEGAKAALSAFDYLQKIEGKFGVIADWHKKN